MSSIPEINFEAKPKPTPSGKKSRRRKRSTLPPAEICPDCGAEMAIRYRRRWWCVECHASELFREAREVRIR